MWVFNIISVVGVNRFNIRVQGLENMRHLRGKPDLVAGYRLSLEFNLHLSLWIVAPELTVKKKSPRGNPEAHRSRREMVDVRGNVNTRT